MPASPRTAAGRALLEWIGLIEQPGYDGGNTFYDEIRTNFLPRIEAEAAQQASPPPPETLRSAPLDVEALARAIEAANIATGWMVDPRSISNFMRLERTRKNQAEAIAAEYARLAPAQPAAPVDLEDACPRCGRKWKNHRGCGDWVASTQARPADAPLWEAHRLLAALLIDFHLEGPLPERVRRFLAQQPTPAEER